MATSISTVKAREALKARHEPHYVKLTRGQYLGFQKLTPTSTGSWVARYRDEEAGKQRKRGLGDFSTLPPSDRYGAAAKAAGEWFAHLGKGGASKAVTVLVACANYVDHVRADRGDTPADDMRMRFKRWVDSDAGFSRTDLQKLTKTRVEHWRKALAKTPAKISRDDRAVPLTRPRAASSVNRDMAALRAALNFAHDAGHVTSDMAWRVALRPIVNADGQRDAYLDRAQRTALIGAAQADVGVLLRALCLVPLRPGALAALTVASLDKRLGVLTIGKDKSGRDRKIKLPPSLAEFFAECSKDKLPAAPLVSRADGKGWNKDSWKKPIKAAARAINLPESTTAYAMRHSTITDLVTGGLDLLTVAQLSGTSVAMIERHYGHLRADHAAQALAGLAL
jgi:site-specific recombinase XerD